MRILNFRNAILFKLAIVVIGIIIFYVLFTCTNLRYSIVGHIIRFSTGENGAAQTVNDLSDKVNQIGSEKLRKWAIETMDEYNSGKIKGKPIECCSAGNIKVISRNITNFTVTHFDVPPEVLLNPEKKDNQAKYIILSWGADGIYIGRKDLLFPRNPFYCIYCEKQVTPGIYTYFMSR
jgi:hypothetical protein